jgi:hypothetical protein
MMTKDEFLKFIKGIEPGHSHRKMNGEMTSCFGISVSRPIVEAFLKEEGLSNIEVTADGDGSFRFKCRS